MKIIDMKNYQASDNNAVIYFLRRHHWTQQAVKSTFYINDKLIGTLADDDEHYTYMAAEVPAGTYKVSYKMHDVFGGRTQSKEVTVNAGSQSCFYVFKAIAGYSEKCPKEIRGKNIGTVKFSD
jgi:hypothetical protein